VDDHSQSRFKSVGKITAPSHDKWLVYFLIYIAIVLFQMFILEHESSFLGAPESGWDLRAYCAAIESHAGGLNPYDAKYVKDTHLPYPYLPVTLDIFRPACSEFLTRHFRVIYFALAAISAFLLSTFSFSGQTIRDGFLKTLYVFGGFVGFGWVFWSGNFAILSGLLTAVALCFFYHGFSLQEKDARNPRSNLFYVLGAIVFGLAMSIKIIFAPVLISLYFFPLARIKKITLMVIAGTCFIIPVLVSFLFYYDLFFSWLDAISGRIPGQISPAREQSASLLDMGQALASSLGFIHYKLLDGLLYATAIALILGPLTHSTIWFVKHEYAVDGKSFLKKLDQFLIDNSRFAMRVATLTMLALYLCAPRLKEYAFLELTIYAAMLVVDLPAKWLAVTFAVTIAGPIIASGLEISPFIDQFNQTITAVFCYGILLIDLHPAFLRLKKKQPISHTDG
jgi:hypothetical protein